MHPGPTTTFVPHRQTSSSSRSRGYSYDEGRDMANMLTLIAERDGRHDTSGDAALARAIAQQDAQGRWPSAWTEQPQQYQYARPPSRTATPRHATPMRPPSTNPAARPITPRRSTPALPANAGSAARPIAPRRSTPALPNTGSPSTSPQTPPQRWIPSSYPSHYTPSGSRPTSPQVWIPPNGPNMSSASAQSSSRPTTPKIWIPPPNTSNASDVARTGSPARATTPQRWIPSPAAFAERTGSPVQRVSSPRVASSSSASAATPSPLNPERIASPVQRVSSPRVVSAGSVASATPSPLNPVVNNPPDEVIARQLARTWHVESLQGTLWDDPTYSPNASLYRVQSPPISSHTRTVSNSGGGSELLARTLRRNSVSQSGPPPTVISSASASASANARNIPHGPAVVVEADEPDPSPQHSPIPQRPASLSVSPVPSMASSDGGVYGPGPDSQLVRYRRLFTSGHSCPRCGAGIEAPRIRISLSSSKCPPASLIDAMHARCGSCRRTFCCGCDTPFSCPIGCAGSSTCVAGRCCSKAVAVGVFHVLSAFDTEYTRRAKGLAQAREQRPVETTTREMRENFINLVVSRTQPSTLEWEKVAVGALRALDALLVHTGNPGEDGDDSRSQTVHPTVALLIRMSTLPELLSRLLRARSVSDWVALSDMYCAALAVLKTMANCGLAAVLQDPLQRIAETNGLEHWMWGDASISWEQVDGGEVDEADEARIARSPPIYDLVRGLERHRRPLLELASRIRFAATVQKVHVMCDGILYLLLQQMVP
ncbi:hypothetical protein HGRIS_008810 [Hohenbuehelia grisea]|uniref:Uncharacterized protein n=1 Tax=Hohenbuehelia grisea TaxID=104357 RepID=A0ABR3J943_9AGAR